MNERPMRFEIDRPVDFRITDMRGTPTFQGRTVNISSGGVLFRTEQSIGVGRKVDMVIHMAEGDSESLEVNLRLLGRIVRSGPGWAAAQVGKHQLVPTIQPGTQAGKGKSPDTPAGL
jgi:hypothetical protein